MRQYEIVVRAIELCKLANPCPEDMFPEIGAVRIDIAKRFWDNCCQKMKEHVVGEFK